MLGFGFRVRACDFVCRVIKLGFGGVGVVLDFGGFKCYYVCFRVRI